MAREYRKRIDEGYDYELAREVFTPYCVRQNFIVTFNIRSLMHFLDLRAKKDAQQEIQIMANMMMDHFRDWAPEIAKWYTNNRLGKGRLAP
jgi:thymidylate synthase (FAD)